jgi:enoyl-CoA hydratase/carnithine racemase
MMTPLSFQRFQQICQHGFLAEEYSVVLGTNYLVVDASGPDKHWTPAFWPSCVVIGFCPETSSVSEHQQQIFDVIVTQEHLLRTLVQAIDAHPVAAATLVEVLRHNEQTTVDQGLMVESLAYSTLQQSSEFQSWLASRTPGSPTTSDEPVLVTQHDTTGRQTTLHLTFNRPQVHNAYNSTLKDQLCEALAFACTDKTITKVQLAGNGPSFCAGGDLTEFGLVNDAAQAHLSRRTRSAATYLALLAMSEHTTTGAHLHGACIGAGIELPAFTQWVTASADSFFQLPEVAMGLIPGAGGTVSVLNRIGRQRTAWMALSNERLDAATALSWGLIDAITD